MAASDTTPVITLYVTDEYQLCGEAQGLLRRLGQEMGFRLETVNIQEHASLYELWGDEIPSVSAQVKRLATRTRGAGHSVPVER